MESNSVSKTSKSKDNTDTKQNSNEESQTQTDENLKKLREEKLRSIFEKLDEKESSQKLEKCLIF